MKTVYMCFATDVIHEGHMNVVKKAKEYGKVVAGVLCDAEMVRYNRFPTVSFEERMAMVRNIPEIDEVIVQDRIMYDNVIKELKPDYVIHGDNWCDGPEKTIRENVIALLKEYGGELIEVPYTYNEKVKKIDDQFKEKLAMPEYRRKRLRQLIKTVPIVKTIEVHSGLTGLIAEKTVVEHDGGLDQFDAMWISSLCDSTAKGKPDIELVDMSSRLRTIDDVLDVTTKPIILDGDTGGLIEHFVYNVRTLERMGVSAVIIEDKTGLKKNSLFGTEVEQTQDSIENFCAKIRAGKNVLRTEEFMIDRLTVFHNHIIQKLFIFRVLLQPFITGQPVKHNPICPEGCRKVDQCGFQFMQIDQIGIVCIASDTFFYLSTSFIDDPEICLINRCRPV